MAKKILCIFLILVTLVTMTSCGAVKYDPGFFQVTKSNRSHYWKFDVDKGSTTPGTVRESFSFDYTIKTRAGDRYEDCYMIVEFKANDVVERVTIEIPEEGGHFIERVTLDIPATNKKIKAKYKVVEVGGAVYTEQKKPLFSSKSYIEDNNLKLTQQYFKSFKNRYWTYDFDVEYKKKNNTETLYFADTIFTKSGTQVSVKSYSFIDGYRRFGKMGQPMPMDRVERIIIDCTMPFSEFIYQDWSSLDFYFPNLNSIYVRDIVYDKEINGKWNPEYVSDVTFYIGGDIEACRNFMNESILDAYSYDIDSYDKDNVWN